MKPTPEEGNEYSIKAMFVYNFAKYIEWPSTMNDGTLRIGVIGKSDIYDALETIASQKKIDNRQIEVRKITPEDNSRYHIIIIAKSQSSKLDECVKKYSGKGVLIVTEEYKNAEHGSTINLITTNNKVRFELNQTSARNAGLKVSSTLANLAVVVNP